MTDPAPNAVPTDPLPLVRRYFPQLAPERLARLARLAALVREWNARLNLISRRDIENLEERHLLHSLAVAHILRPAAGARILDLGTGGGFPGLPVAIAFPECAFTLVDSIAKKTRAVETIATKLGLENVRVITARAESVRDRADFVLGRAVAALPDFLRWAAPLARSGNAGEPANGILYFKGSRYLEELPAVHCRPTTVWNLHEIFPEPFFAEKFLLHFAAPVRP